MSRRQTRIILTILISLNFVAIINTQHLPLCESLDDIESNDPDPDPVHSDVKTRRVRALCDAIYSSRARSNDEDLDAIPDFDLRHISSDADANQILKRFRRSRFSSSRSSSSSGSSSSGSRFSSGFSRSSSGSSSSSGSRFFGGSRSSSSGSSRLFGSSSSSGSSGSRIFSRSGSSSGTSGSRIFSRSGSSSSSGSRGGLFSRSSSSSGSGHRVRSAIRSVIRKPSSSGSSSRLPSGSGGLAGIGGSKPGLSDKIRKITHGGGTGGFGSGGSRYGSGFGGSRYGAGGFGAAGSSGTGGNAWVRTGKKFLPYAVRFGKRYYQRRKYSKGMYAGIGAGAGYYAGSRMSGHHGNDYPNDYYGYPPASDVPPPEVDGGTPTVFYCIQEDLNTTLVNQTLNAEGFGVCNISGELVTCPIEIECKTSEADTCCEDEQGKPICCGGPIPEEYASQYGGYGDDLYDTADSVNKMLNMLTAVSVLLATICYRMWRREE